jgi:septal ring-binding cell division protein DamX
MNNSLKYTGIIVSICTLCACSTYNPNGYTNYQTYNDKQGTELYPEGYENTGHYADYPSKQMVQVPESYHVSATHAPVKPKDADHQWVSSQSTSGYTIEVANGEKAAQVASTLLKVPKNERMAEVKYQQGDRTLYKGVYGSYPTKEAAQQAMEALPADVKSSAQIKSWGSVQNDVGG